MWRDKVGHVFVERSLIINELAWFACRLSGASHHQSSTKLYPGCGARVELIRKGLI